VMHGMPYYPLARVPTLDGQEADRQEDGYDKKSPPRTYARAPTKQLGHERESHSSATMSGTRSPTLRGNAPRVRSVIIRRCHVRWLQFRRRARAQPGNTAKLFSRLSSVSRMRDRLLHWRRSQKIFFWFEAQLAAQFFYGRELNNQ
jgi:hypothetical protein